jgi:DMSO/TMAO reductase YedYZ heme-binding membrane subunit
VEDKLFHADRRTDMAKLIVAFCNFANTPNNRLKHTPNLTRMRSAAYDTFT